MDDNHYYRKTVAWITILSGVIGFISYLLVAGSVHFNFDFFSNPILIFSLPGVDIGMLRWSMIADIFGYYLLLLPVLFFIHEWLLGKTPWRNLITFCGTSYILAGAIGASILAATWPSLLLKFPISSTEQQETIKLIFESFSVMVGNGIWNLFDTIVCGVWMTGIGMVIKKENSYMGWLTMLVGIISLLDGLGNSLEIKSISDTALNLYLVLAPLWAIILGLLILNNKIFLYNK